MLNINVLLKWFQNKANVALVREAWVFGSILDRDKNVNDVDFFILYHDGEAEAVPGLKRSLMVGFEKEFSLPLHLLCLSETESKEPDIERFLKAALSKAIRVR
jgi:predicted nucleotidyltransferase